MQRPVEIDDVGSAATRVSGAAAPRLHLNNVATRQSGDLSQQRRRGGECENAGEMHVVDDLFAVRDLLAVHVSNARG